MSTKKIDKLLNNVLRDASLEDLERFQERITKKLEAVRSAKSFNVTFSDGGKVLALRDVNDQMTLVYRPLSEEQIDETSKSIIEECRSRHCGGVETTEAYRIVLEEEEDGIRRITRFQPAKTPEDRVDH